VSSAAASKKIGTGAAEIFKIIHSYILTCRG